MHWQHTLVVSHPCVPSHRSGPGSTKEVQWASLLPAFSPHLQRAELTDKGTTSLHIMGQGATYRLHVCMKLPPAKALFPLQWLVPLFGLPIFDSLHCVFLCSGQNQHLCPCAWQWIWFLQNASIQSKLLQNEEDAYFILHSHSTWFPLLIVLCWHSWQTKMLCFLGGVSKLPDTFCLSENRLGEHALGSLEVNGNLPKNGGC